MIIILDYGTKYLEKVLEYIKGSTIILDYKTDIETIKKYGPKGIIISGSPYHVYNDDSPKLSSDIIELGIPILGICYGMQLIVHTYKGIVSKMLEIEQGEFCTSTMIINDDSVNKNIFSNIPKLSLVEMRHFDAVTQVPDNFIITANTKTCIAAIKHKEKHIYGVQFHPEIQTVSLQTRRDNVCKEMITETEGMTNIENNSSYIIKNFVNICYDELNK